MIGENISNILTNNLIAGSSKDSVEGIRFAKEDGDEIVEDDNFKEMLKNTHFYEFLRELVDYSLEYYKKNSYLRSLDKSIRRSF